MIVARTALASARPAVALVSPSSTVAAKRLLHASTSARDAAHGGNAAEQDDYYPPEGFNTPMWRWTIFGTLAFVGYYRWTSTRGVAADDEERKQQPWLVRYLDYHRHDSSAYKKIGEAHLEGIRERARGSLVLTSAQRPEILRLRNTSSFDQASPHGLPVGGQVDVSDVERV